MSFLKSIPIIGKLFTDTAEIAREFVLDKDKQNEIIGNLEKIKQGIDKEIYAQELSVKTIPWVDALHKMGRQILNLIVIISVVFLTYYGKEITGEMMLLMGGGNVAYQLIKGRGK